MLKVLVILVVICLSANARLGPNLSKFAATNRAFSGTMYHRIVKDSKDPNVIFSPFSISQALGMVLAGAQENTNYEIKRLLELTKYEDWKVHKLMRKVYRNCLERPTGQTLELANRMYVEEGFEINPGFTNVLEESYNAKSYKVNFTQPEVTAQRINGWVANKTEGLINGLVDPSTITDLTRLILINAIYFKATWKAKFQKLEERCPFYLTRDHSKDVECMKFSGDVRVKIDHDNQMTFAAFPYKSELPTTSYLVIGVHDHQNLTKFLPNARLAIKSWDVSLWPRRDSQVTMPTFIISGNLDMKQILINSGIEDLFQTGVSNLRGIRDEPLHVSNFVHKAYIDVNENGTEAAAASSVSILSRSNDEPLNLKADNPFFFAIYNGQSQVFTFMGRVGDPTAK